MKASIVLLPVVRLNSSSVSLLDYGWIGVDANDTVHLSLEWSYPVFVDGLGLRYQATLGNILLS
jgi:hypothetical protein